jgi:hypothetical protein
MDHPGPESLSDDEIMYTIIIHVFTNKKQIYMNNKKKLYMYQKHKQTLINFFINMYKMFLNYN